MEEWSVFDIAIQIVEDMPQLKVILAGKAQSELIIELFSETLRNWLLQQGCWSEKSITCCDKKRLKASNVDGAGLYPGEK